MTSTTTPSARAPVWIRESALLWYHRFVIRVLKAGPIPHHIAFIMDGNRRYARKSHIGKAEGHSRGFEKLSEALQWCLEIGIGEVTVYAFSIENFKRTQDEVDTLMNLAREKFNCLLDERDKLHERGICIRIIGNLELLPADLRRTVAEAMLLTRNNRTAVLNVAFAYTSRDEMTHSIRTVAADVAAGALQPDDVSVNLLTDCLYTRRGTEPDLLVRTSGEVRLSDFLLWQSDTAVVYFTDILWPEFTIWQLFGAVFYYQRHCSQTGSVRNALQSNAAAHGQTEPEAETNGKSATRIGQFLAQLDQRETDELTKLVAATSLK